MTMSSKKDHRGKSYPNNSGGRKKGRSGYGLNRNYGSQRQFPKFADNDYRNNEDNYNEPKYWSQNDWNNDVGTVIVPWHRQKPMIPLVIPPQPSNDNRKEADEKVYGKKNQHMTKPVAFENANNIAISEKILSNSESSLKRSRNNAISTNNNKVSEKLSSSEVALNSFKVLIKQEKQDIKKEPNRECESSSSLSTSSESSNEEISEQIPIIKTEAKESSATVTHSSPLNVKIYPKASIVKETLNSPITKRKASSSSSSEEKEEQSKPVPPSTTKPIKPKLRKETKQNSSKKKRCSEDDVVYIGNLVNKIVVEDDSEHEKDETPDKSKKTNKTENCMICDKEGHTSIQCQMICKNCSAPYHSYRTCPHPANLNTMLQLFLEFCMQQFQHFIEVKDLGINSSNGVPKPKVDLPTTHAANKILKRKQSKTSDPNTKNKSAKKRISGDAKKKNLKHDDDSDSSSEEGTTETDDQTSSKTLVSSKKKLKLKNKTLSIPSFTPNPLNLPLVLNGFQNLTAGAAGATNSNTSNNALNTLLLTQMFQNVIGSLKQV